VGTGFRKKILLNKGHTIEEGEMSVSLLMALAMGGLAASCLWIVDAVRKTRRAPHPE
jgi:hypothetical protein